MVFGLAALNCMHWLRITIRANDLLSPGLPTRISNAFLCGAPLSYIRSADEAETKLLSGMHSLYVFYALATLEKRLSIFLQISLWLFGSS